MYNKKRVFLILFSIITASITSYMKSQITIGSDNAPMAGSLLQLKQYEPDGSNTTAIGGLGLPRVKLTDINNLYPMFDGDADYTGNVGGKKTTEDASHIGLLVYHPDVCTLKGSGIYVWGGNEWEKIGMGRSGSLTFNREHFDLASGYDARPYAAQDLEISWSGATPGWTMSPVAGYDQPTFYMNPLTPTTLTSSPTTITIKPDYFYTGSTPWRILKSEITFTDVECGGLLKTITLTQANYALKVNDYVYHSMIIYRTPGNGSFTVSSNATWTSSLYNPDNAISNTTTPAIGTTQGSDKTADYDKDDILFNYTTNPVGKYFYANVTFKDSQSPKRMKDIVVTIQNCDATTEPGLDGSSGNMDHWLKRAGLESTPKDTPHPTTTIAWHTDQDGNIFYSADFGADPNSSDGRNRWMITNLAAKNYAPGVTHAAGRTLAGPFGNDNADYNVAYWGYPSISGSPSDPTDYDLNNRVGLFYSWDAATAGKGGSNGQAYYDEGGALHARVQGICPAGWHLPSDREWTNLENEMMQHTSNYSTTADLNPGVPETFDPTDTNSTGDRGIYCGKAMTDICEPTGFGIGTSNVMSVSKPGGFSILYTGMANNGSTSGFGENVGFLSSSGWGSDRYWYRNTGRTGNGVFRYPAYRSGMMSVRCKKD